MLPADLFFGILSAFLVGVLTASAGWSFFLVSGIGLLLGAVIIYRRKFSVFWLGVFLVALFLGAFYFHVRENMRDAGEPLPQGEGVVVVGMVGSEAKFTDKSQRLLVRLRAPYEGNIMVFTDRVPEYRIGDVLTLIGKIEPPDERFVESTLFFPKIENVEHAEPRGFLRVKRHLADLKHLFISEFKAVLPPASAALLSGLTFGSQSDFSSEFKDKMSLSGTTHLVALSGYNIAILVLAIAGSLGRILSRRATFIVTVMVIVLFVLMVGAEASVVRAAIMGFLILFAKEAGRIYSFRNAVTLAAFVMVLFNPRVLAFDLGFQLSFVSLLGIVYLMPALTKFFQKFSRKRFGATHASIFGWKENALTTLSAQLAVAPLIIQNFEHISATSLLANVLILAFVPLTMFAGFALGIVSLMFSYLGVIMAWFVNLLLTYEIFVIELFAAVRLPVGASLSWIIFAAYYAVLIWFILKSNRHDTQSISRN